MKKNYNVFTAYPKSKYELILFSCELAKYVRKMGYKNLSVVCVDTGIAKTHLGETVQYFYCCFFYFFSKTWKGSLTKAYVNIFGQTVEKAAERPLLCCLSSSIQDRHGMFILTNNKSKDLYEQEDIKSQGELLWEISCKLTRNLI